MFSPKLLGVSFLKGRWINLPENWDPGRRVRKDELESVRTSIVEALQFATWQWNFCQWPRWDSTEGDLPKILTNGGGEGQWLSVTMRNLSKFRRLVSIHQQKGHRLFSDALISCHILTPNSSGKRRLPGIYWKNIIRWSWMCLQKCHVLIILNHRFGKADVVITSGGVSRGNKETGVFLFFPSTRFTQTNRIPTWKPIHTVDGRNPAPVSR